jgi:hypothetical protein
MKLTDSLDRASTARMRAAARPRFALLALIGFALVAPLISESAIAAATGSDKPAKMVASAGLEPPPTPGLRREGSRGDEKGNF